jgi:excisionase family DNA binding protein
LPRSRTGWRRGEKRAEAAITADYLDAALADFSGYIAADELYDGPYCVLSIVDNRHFKRLLYEVLDHNPTEEDILRFFRRFHEALIARGLETGQGSGAPLMQAIDHHSQDSRWLTIQEVSLRLHVSRDTVERWINTGEIRSADVSGRRGKNARRSSWRISVESLEAFLDARANRTQIPHPRTSPRRSEGLIEFIK